MSQPLYQRLARASPEELTTLLRTELPQEGYISPHTKVLYLGTTCVSRHPLRIELQTTVRHENAVGEPGAKSTHRILVTADLAETITLRVTGTNFDDIKPDIESDFRRWLWQPPCQSPS